MTRRLSIPSLTGMRAFAAYLVFFHHFAFSYPLINGFCFQGYIGVGLFYVLSGFLITYIYEPMQLSVGSYLRYLWKRFARIYPVYLLALFVMVWLATDSFDLEWWVYQLTLYKGLHDWTKFQGVAQAWSITVELVFYLLAPFLIILLKSKTKYFVVPAIYLIGYLMSLTGSFGSFKFILVYTFFGRALDFILGGLIALWFAKQNTHPISKYKTYLGFASIILIELVLQNYGPPFSKVHLITSILVLPFAVGLFLIGLIQEDNILTKLFSSKLFQILGKGSYSFYLFQVIIVTAFTKRFELTQNLNVLLSFIVLNIVSVCIYYLFEEPVHNLLLGKKIRWLSQSNFGQKKKLDTA